MRRPIMRLAYWIGMRRWPSWMKTTATMTPSAMSGKNSFSIGPPFHQAWMPVGSAVRMEAKMMSEIPLPTPRFVISSPIHMRSVQPAVSVSTMITNRPAVRVERAGAVEEERVADRLGRREHDGQVARVLVDLGVAGLAFLLHLLQPRDDDRHQLEDDRGRDVRHDPEREHGEARQRAAREEVQQPEDRAAAGREVALDLVGVDARRGHPRPEAVDEQHRAP